jgi:hypothetical protein
LLKFIAILCVFVIMGCGALHGQRIGDILDDIRDNVENVRTIDNSSQIDYIKVRLNHLESEVSK